MIRSTHRRLLALSMAAALAALLLSSCGKPKPPVITEWALYENEFYHFQFDYPKGWLVNDEASRVKIYSSQDAASRFFDPTQEGDGGVEILFGFENFKDAGASTLDGYLQATKQNLANIGQVQAEQPATLGGEQGMMIPYVSKISSKKTIYARRYITMRDSVFYYMNFAGFNDDYELYKAVFDTVLASVKLPRPKPAKGSVDETKPSQELVKYAGDVIEMKYPDNFEAKFPPKKGEIQFSVSFSGYRVDCTIEADMQPAKKLTVDKAFDQSKKVFTNIRTTGDVTIDGNAGKYLDCAPTPTIERRAYFTVKNDKLYRFIFTWYKPMTSDYWPVFEKCLASVKIK